jgi:ketosteroid isomerase-like protein
VDGYGLGDNPSVSANLDLVRSIFAAHERGDLGDAAWARPDIQYVFVDGPSPGTFTGLAGMAEGWRDFLSSWDDVRNMADEFRDLDRDRVLVLGHASGRGKKSRIELSVLSTRWANVFHLADGRVTRIDCHFDADCALTDLSLTPEEPHDAR